MIRLDHREHSISLGSSSIERMITCSSLSLIFSSSLNLEPKEFLQSALM